MNPLEARRRLLGRNVYKRTTEGNPAIAQGSLARRYPGITMQGWTEQDSTTGAQLINQDETVIGGLVGNVGNELDGTNRIRTGFIRVEPNTTYIISGLSGFNIANSFAYDSEKTLARIGAVTTTTTTLENESYLRISFSKPDQSDFTEEELQKLRKTLMFNKGDVALPYEPYTGSKPSPSPDYPQEIVSAGKYSENTQKWEYEVKLTGKNLFDISKVITISGLLTNNGDGTLTATPGSGDSAVGGKAPRTLRDYCPGLISGKTYRLSGNTTGTIKQIYLLGVNNIWMYGYSRTITDADLGSEVLFYASGINTEAVISDIMITEVDGADYEPYRTPQTVLLQSDRPLTKWDRLEKRDGQWGWVFKSLIVEFDGSDDEDWIRTNQLTIRPDLYLLKSKIYKNVKLQGESYVDAYTKSDNKQMEQDKRFYDRDSYFGESRLAIRHDEYSDIAEWKTHLSEHPITWVVKAETETFVPLTESEQSALNALHTNYPTTVLVNDQGCNMKLTYKTKKSLEVT